MAHFMNYNPNNPPNIINNNNHHEPMIINPNNQHNIINNNNHHPQKLKKHRLFLELEYLENIYQEVNVKMIHRKETVVEAKYPLQSIPKYIKFIIPKDYPFKPPDIFIRSKNAYEIGGCVMGEEQTVEKNYLYTIHNCHLPRIHRIVKKIQRVTKTEDSRPTCLKCRSIIVHDNWSPAFQMKHIFDEIAKNNSLKRRVRIEIGLEEIFDKYKQLPEVFMSILREYLYH